MADTLTSKMLLPYILNLEMINLNIGFASIFSPRSDTVDFLIKLISLAF